jgi:hypothetical protein
VHVVPEPSLNKPAEQFWQMLFVPSMKYWLVPQHTLELAPVHRLISPAAQDPLQSVHAVAPVSLYFPGEHSVQSAKELP